MNTVPEDNAGQSAASPRSTALTSDTPPVMPTLVFVHGACVRRLLYVTSVMPDAGQSQADMIGGEPAPGLQPGRGHHRVNPDMMPEYFMQDCDEATVEAAVPRLTRQSLAPFSQPPREIAWRSTPASYIVCTQDIATPAETQRGRIRAGAHHVEFDAGHHPFLSRPDASAQLLVDEIRASLTTAA